MHLGIGFVHVSCLHMDNEIESRWSVYQHQFLFEINRVASVRFPYVLCSALPLTDYGNQ